MTEVSIDMSVDEETAGDRIFGKVIDIQNDTLICEYTGANYDYGNAEKIRDLMIKIVIVTEALETIKTAATFGRIKGLNVDTPDGMRLKSIANLAEQAIKKIKE